MSLLDSLRERLGLEEKYEDELSPFSDAEVDLDSEKDGDDSTVQDRRE